MKTRIFAYLLPIALLLVATTSIVYPQNVFAQDDACVIPDSGPWPPCARGGNTTPTSTESNEPCVIPTTGPWPPCATGGNGTPDSQEPVSADSNICPTSGAWPSGCTPASQPAPANPPAAPSSGAPCPSSSAWPPGCIPSDAAPEADTLEDVEVFTLEQAQALVREKRRFPVESDPVECETEELRDEPLVSFSTQCKYIIAPATAAQPIDSQIVATAVLSENEDDSRAKYLQVKEQDQAFISGIGAGGARVFWENHENGYTSCFALLITDAQAGDIELVTCTRITQTKNIITQASVLLYSDDINEGLGWLSRIDF